MRQLWRFSYDPTSEDRLFLNVWTPAADPTKRPVMFWCHGGVLRAMHGEDTGLAFDNVSISRDGLYGPGPAPQQIADIVSGAWTSVAQTGAPSHPGIPAWPHYSIDRRETFIVDVPPHLKNAPQRTLREFWFRVEGDRPTPG